jgi:alginate O-acetyltransferase complex protein AlgI
LAWGALQGAVLIAERAGILRLLERIPTVIQRLYALALIVAGWILFRSDTFGQAAGTLRAVVRVRDWITFDWGGLTTLVTKECWIAIVIGILAATPLGRRFADKLLVKQTADPWSASPAGVLASIFLLVLSAMKLASSSFNPFIYYRF